MRSRHFRPTCCMLLLAAFASAPQTASAQTEAAKAEAMRRYQEGIAAHDKGKEEDAYISFSQAYVVVKTPRVLFNLARSEQLTGRLLEAAAHYREYIAWPEHPHVTKEKREKARAFLSEVEARLGRIAIDAPAGATITIDGRDWSGSAEPVEVLPGAHTLVARSGERTARTEIVATAGAVTRATLKFEDTPAPAPPAPVASATTIAPASTAPKDAGAPAAPSGRAVVRWASVGLGVAGLGVGLGFAVSASSKSDEVVAYRAAHPNACAVPSSAACNGEQSLRSDHDRSATISTIGFVAGAVGIVGAAYSWFFWRDLIVTPTVGPTAYGVDLQGRF